MWIRQSVERNTAAVVRQLQSPISGSQPAGAGRWLAADRRIDFCIGINLGCVCRRVAGDPASQKRALVLS
jgi:hypothetical protein